MVNTSVLLVTSIAQLRFGLNSAKMVMDRHRQLDKMAPCTVKSDLELVQLMATKVQGAPSAKSTCLSGELPLPVELSKHHNGEKAKEVSI